MNTRDMTNRAKYFVFEGLRRGDHNGMKLNDYVKSVVERMNKPCVTSESTSSGKSWDEEVAAYSQNNRSRIRYHEAGHATTAVLLGATVEKIYLSNSLDKESFVLADHSGFKSIAKAAYCLSGAAAERAFTPGFEGGPSDSDLERALPSLKSLHSSMARKLTSPAFAWSEEKLPSALVDALAEQFRTDVVLSKCINWVSRKLTEKNLLAIGPTVVKGEELLDWLKTCLAGFDVRTESEKRRSSTERPMGLKEAGTRAKIVCTGAMYLAYASVGLF